MRDIENYTANENTEIVNFGNWTFYENDFGIGRIYSWACNFGRDLVAYIYNCGVREFEVTFNKYDSNEVIESFTVDNLADAIRKAEEVLI